MTSETSKNPEISDGVNPARRVQIKIPERRGIDEDIWKDLEEYLFCGFLSSPATVLDNDFVFKTLNHQEIKNIYHLRKTSEFSKTFKATFIAYSVYVAIGTNVLHKRSDHISQLIESITKVPSDYQDKILDNLNCLNKRASRLYPLVEVYAYEPRSRYKWLYLKKLAIHSTEATGISGTSDLGMNYCQQTWVAMNEVIDRKEEIEVSWSHAKFVGSCFAGKGMVSIDEQDKSRRRREEQEIEEKKSRVLREYIAGSDGKQISPDEGTTTLPDGRRATIEGRWKAESAEELADQLSAALSGEKDWHDRMVEEHFKRAKVEQETLTKQSRQIASMPKHLIEAGRPAAGASRVLDKQDVDAYVKRMQSLMIDSVKPMSPPDLSSDIDRSKSRSGHRG